MLSISNILLPGTGLFSYIRALANFSILRNISSNEKGDSMDSEVQNVVIIGSGCAGLTAAIYTARADLDPLVIEGSLPGGQLSTTTEVENYPGFENGIQGPDLMDEMRKQAERFGTKVVFGDVQRVNLMKRPFEIHTDKNVYLSK